MNMLPVKLADLEPEFIRWEDRVDVIDGAQVTHTYLPHADSLAEAQGIEFICPKCRNHCIHVAFAGRGVADHHGTHGANGIPTRWQVSGSGFEDLTLSPSVDCTPSDPNCWHGFIQNGVAT